MSFPIDIMHCVFLGITKKLTSLCIESSDGEPYNLKPHLSDIERFIEVISSQCSTFSRKLRKLSLLANWKANEWKNWLFYYAPVIIPSFLPSKYSVSFIKFSKAIFTLCNSLIKIVDLDNCRKDLESFISECEELYGVSSCTLNLHLLYHIPDFVKRFRTFMGVLVFSI